MAMRLIEKGDIEDPITRRYLSYVTEGHNDPQVIPFYKFYEEIEPEDDRMQQEYEQLVCNILDVTGHVSTNLFSQIQD